METIQSLRKKGYKVRVIHERRWLRRSDYPDSEVFTYTKREIIHNDNFEILSKGGKTIIEVTEPFIPSPENLINMERKSVKGEAICSNKETFNRKIGNNIALGRALKQL